MSAGSSDRPKWTDVVSVIIAFVALIISIYSLNKSYAVEQGLQRASVRQEMHIAKSTEFNDQIDKDWFLSQRLAPHIIHTDYQRSVLANYDPTLKQGFVFLLLINDGPNDVKSLTISSINWKPASSEMNFAYGVDVKQALPVLRKDHFYALLIDVLEPIDASKAWSVANFDSDNPNFESVNLFVTYEDGLSKENIFEVNLEGTVPYPIEVTPPDPIN